MIEYILDVLADEAITFSIMEDNNCDYDSVMGRALLSGVGPTKTIFHTTWS